MKKVFDSSRYSTRLIALKFAYLGQRYNGLEYHTNNDTPLPTVEEELWKALSKACLILPTPNPELKPDEPNWEGCEYSKCGRTDKGVSAFAQVIGIRVRSNRPLDRAQASTSPGEAQEAEAGQNTDTAGVKVYLDETRDQEESELLTAIPSTLPSNEQSPLFHHIYDELPYCQALNRLLPPDIRILAWCPTLPPNFSARFSCKERRYRYFFTQPAFTPTPGTIGLQERTKGPTPVTGRRREGWLDIDAMREAAAKFIGLHDFRNFCKVDPSKQIENFDRRIFHAEIEKMDPLQEPAGYVGSPAFSEYEDLNPGWRFEPSIINGEPYTPNIYTFTLHGSAFLWHQVRHMVAILFLVGQGLESPAIVDELLDVQKNPQKPQYEMADDAPLVLWDCMFPRPGSESQEDALEWHYIGADTEEKEKRNTAVKRKSGGRYGVGGVVDEIWKVWRGRKIDEVLAGAMLDVIAEQDTRNWSDADGEASSTVDEQRKSSTSKKVFQGGNGYRSVGTYTPLMQKPRMERIEVINAKYAKRKGIDEKQDGKSSSSLSVEPATDSATT